MLFVLIRWNLEVSPNDAGEIDSADEAVQKVLVYHSNLGVSNYHWLCTFSEATDFVQVELHYSKSFCCEHLITWLLN